MAAARQSSHGRNDSKITLEIRTKSIEQTLIPLVTQVSERAVENLQFYRFGIRENANVNYG